MSGYLWTALTPNVRGSIDTQPDGDAATKECGCDNRGGKWWLCQYHSGFHDALEESPDNDDGGGRDGG